MHEALDSLDAVALRDGVVGSREEFALAAYLCGRAFETKTNIARSPRLEYMLWLCGRRDIKSAMESCGPKEEENEFIVAVLLRGQRGKDYRGPSWEEAPLRHPGESPAAGP